ncbi:MAG: hypothetical protein ACJAXK_002489 [Yoonia sp.]|jgi:hypothetical protein
MRISRWVLALPTDRKMLRSVEDGYQSFTMANASKRRAL